jgi:hypothetical protein
MKRPVPSGKPFELGPVKLTYGKHGRSVNHGETPHRIGLALSIGGSILTLCQALMIC